MTIQTDLYSFSYKLGKLVPWCKKCGCTTFWKNGCSSNGEQICKCKRCGFRFVWTSDFAKRRFFSNVINFAVELYSTTGISLKNVSKKLFKFFKIKVSGEAIRLWVLASRKFGFVVDKTLPSKAWHISKKRLLKDARTVVQQALKRTKIKPRTIITDGLFQYKTAIKKMLATHWNIYKKVHVVDSGIGKNAAIERLNREIKRRIKWFSTFQSLKGAKAFFGLWFYHHNLKTT